MSSSKKYNHGQYFTKHPDLKKKVLEFILNNPTTILEPSIGQGDLVEYVTQHLPTHPTFVMIELDTTIQLLPSINKTDVVYADFIQYPLTQKYTTIIGNPPYVRTKKGNLYIDFTEKCFHALADGGELIFIVPSDFFKLTSSSKLLNTMMTHGTFSHIYHPHNESMFENAAIDVIVYRYCKNATQPKCVLYNGELRTIQNSSGLITFSNITPVSNTAPTQLFQDWFHVYVGMVSGKEEVYKHPLGNLDVLNGFDKKEKYIFAESFPTPIHSVNVHLLEHKSELITRGIRKFNETNWFEWGAPRNLTAIRENFGEDCIYLNTLTRKSDVAFCGKVMHFGGSLLMLLPQKKVDLQKVVTYLNSSSFKDNFIFSGRFKIGHRQLCHSQLPADVFAS